MSTSTQHSTRRRRRTRQDDDAHANHERWLLTYADMITLLMVLFIVLFAISQVDKEKFATLAEGLTKAFGGSKSVVDGNNGVLPGATTATNETQADPAVAAQLTVRPEVGKLRPNVADDHALDQARAQIEAALHRRGLEDAVRFRHTQRGLVVTIVTDDVLFPTGSADLESRGSNVLDAIGPALRTMSNDIVIEGHTDNVPIHGRYASNWELSAVRATTVLRYLISSAHVSPHRLSAAGYADQRGLVPNDTAAHRARNRRVEIVVLGASAQAGSIAPSLTAIAPTTDITPDLTAGAAGPTGTLEGG